MIKMPVIRVGKPGNISVGCLNLNTCYHILITSYLWSCKSSKNLIVMFVGQPVLSGPISLLMMVRILVIYLIVISKLEIWIVRHCFQLGHGKCYFLRENVFWILFYHNDKVITHIHTCTVGLLNEIIIGKIWTTFPYNTGFPGKEISIMSIRL